jgi:hypothetical protein
MMKLKTLTLIGAGFAVALTQAAAASPAPDPKLWAGTWHLNTAKSKFSLPGTAEKAETRNYTVTGDHVVMKTTMTPSTGKPMSWSYDAHWDGKAYPMVGNPGGDHIMLTPVSAREVNSKTMLKGKLSATATASVSPDGKELTIHRKILNVKGGPSDDTLVFDRTE